MKQPLQKYAAFIVKSMLWSLLLYTIVMLVFNRDEWTSRLPDSYTGHITTTAPPAKAAGVQIEHTEAAELTTAAGLVSSLYTLLHIVSGI